MNSSAFIVTFIGTIASVFVISTNAFLLYATRKKKHDIVLFYFRFHVDVVFGMSYFLYSFFILGFTIYESSFFMSNSYFFWLGLPFSNASAARTFLVLIIVLDRLLANRLALLDAFLIFFFDFVPSFLANQFPNSPLIAYTSTGPVTAMLKQVGRAIESFIVVEILVRRNSKVEESRRSKKSSQPPVVTISKH
ncbi:hypothetical protein CAEBREN_21389 [Caenorhabditis brenneri]|uniref:Serpentine receptor class gamma n=1 Tax=Caenorhabditis brenneri TaxID=135651 RepID=G0M931_CAEBE|nr:hypothetical protein CAEBREN_21389 [Caenorhabditis brenneri]